jgi:hypothetical protein
VCPKVWIYDETAFQFYALSEGKYSVIEESNFLPGLTGVLLDEAMEDGKEGDPMDVLKGFRDRVQKLDSGAAATSDKRQVNSEP